MPDLLVAQPDGSLLHSKRVGERSTILIGRHPESGIVIPDDRISRRHAVIFEHEGGWYAVDLDSKAGLDTPLGRVTIHRFDPADAWVGLGPVVVWVEGITRPVPNTPPTPIRRSRDSVLRTRNDFVDRALHGPATDSSPLLLACRSRDPRRPGFRLLDLEGADRVLIGRDPSCDIVVDDETVPELAWLIHREGDKWAVIDLREIRPEETPPKRRRRLGTGITIDVGPVLITVTAAESAIPRREEAAGDGFEEGFDVPDLGSIFDTRATIHDGKTPGKPGDSKS